MCLLCVTLSSSIVKEVGVQQHRFPGSSVTPSLIHDLRRTVPTSALTPLGL